MQLLSFPRRALPGLILGAGLAGSAWAGTVTQQFSDAFPVTTTDWVTSLHVTRFDPALGDLISVTIRLDGRLEGSAGVEALDTAATVVTTTLDATISLAQPGGAPLLAVLPQFSNSANLTPFDGTIDFAGGSGESYPAVQQDASDMATILPAQAALFALFIGPNGNPGQITLPTGAVGHSVATGSGNLITQFATKAGATVTVTYLYNPPITDCNQNQIDDPIDIATGTSLDCNQNQIPDECEPDCDGDNIPDVCEPDCDGDNIPNDCDDPCPECEPTERHVPASLLLYPLFDSRPGATTLITVTNTNCSFLPGAGPNLLAGTVDVEFVYIGRWGVNNVSLPCLETNRTRRLTPCDTLSVIARADNPNHERGYLYVFAKDPVSGAAIVFNHLIGDEVIFNATDLIEDSVDAVPFLGIGPERSLTDDDHDFVRDLDGLEYSKAPDKILIPRFLGQDPLNAAGPNFNSRLILIGLTGGISFTTTVDFLVYNDNEEEFSANWTFFCWDDPRLVEINNVFTESFLDSTSNSSSEIIGTGTPATKEAGWFRINGNNAQSTFTFIPDPAIYAVLVERFGAFGAVALPYELCTQDNGDLLPKGPAGDQ